MGNKYGLGLEDYQTPGGVDCEDILLWFNADYGVTKDTNDKVSRWNDLGPNGYSAAQSSATIQPTYVEGDLNYNPVLNFDDDLLRSTADIGEDQESEITIYSVHRAGDGGNIQSPWGIDDGGSSNTDRGITYLAGGTGLGGVNSGSPNDYVLTDDLFTPNQPVLATIFYDEDETDGSSVRLNGTTTATFTANNGPQSDNNLALGSDGTSGNYFDGDIAELIMFSGSQNSTKRRRIESYLAIKYGITLCLLYTSPSPRDRTRSRMPSSA